MKKIIASLSTALVFFAATLSFTTVAKSAEFLDLEFQQSTKLAMNLLEPMVVVIMGSIVAGIVVAVLLPLIQMNNLSLIG